MAVEAAATGEAVPVVLLIVHPKARVVVVVKRAQALEVAAGLPQFDVPAD